MSETADASKPQNCPHCGMIHETTCPRIKAIEYHANGQIKRVEFLEPQTVKWGWEGHQLIGQPITRGY